MIGDISFNDYKKSSDIHGTILYPAVMVPPVQKAVLSDIINQNDIISVFDPFHGSGTALYEAMEIKPSLRLVGCDINPLANLITKVKLQGVGEHIDKDVHKLKELIKNHNNVYDFTFPNKSKWFRNDIFESLKIVRSAIMDIEDSQDRSFFWYVLCDIIRKYSNTRSSTYKLHTKTAQAIMNMENKLVEDYLMSLDKMYKKFKNHTDNFSLYKCDIKNQIKIFDDEMFDITITSPPYGENATTVPYGQFSMLALYVIPSKDLCLEGWELDNYSIIDSLSLGGKNSDNSLDPFQISLIEPYLSKIKESKRKKVTRFFSDYFNVLSELCRVTNKYLILTLGNRTVDRVQINLTDITIAYLENNRYKNLQKVERDIPYKRIPKITSCVDCKPVSSMNSEYILINKRVG
jgi:hypothetical protein